MKKFLTLVLCFAMVLSLAACGGSDDKETTPSPTPTSKPSSGSNESEKKDDKQKEDSSDNSGLDNSGSDNSGLDNSGSDESGSDESGQNAEVSEDNSAVSENVTNFLADFKLVKPEGDYSSSPWEFRSFDWTGWTVSGAMVDGKANVDVSAFLEEKYGGRLQIVLESISESRVFMIRSKDSDRIEGSLSILDDGYMMSLTFDNGEKYTAVFVDVDEQREVDIDGTSIINVNRTPIMILFPDSTGKNVIYLTYISEA